MSLRVILPGADATSFALGVSQVFSAWNGGERTDVGWPGETKLGNDHLSPLAGGIFVVINETIAAPCNKPLKRN